MKKMIKNFTLILLAIAMMLVFVSCGDDSNTIKYDGKKYVLLEYNSDIFYYDYAENLDYEEDTICPVKSENWDIVMYNGDLFIEKDKHKEASEYYADDANYKWQMIVEQDEDVSFEVTIKAEELAYIYDMENLEKNKSIYIEEIECFGTLEKHSFDGVVAARISLAKYEGSWYWKSEVINDDVDKDGAWAEYIYELPAGLIAQIENNAK